MVFEVNWPLGCTMTSSVIAHDRVHQASSSKSGNNWLISMCIHIYTYINVCTHIYIYTHRYINQYVYLYINIYISTYLYIPIGINILKYKPFYFGCYGNSVFVSKCQNVSIYCQILRTLIYVNTYISLVNVVVTWWAFPWRQNLKASTTCFCQCLQ